MTGETVGGTVGGAAGQAVLVERRDGLAIITLNRPERANAFSAEIRAGLFEAAADIAADESVRAVILTGAGKHFSGGADLRESRQVRAAARKRYPGSTDLSGIPQPVIAAINGAAMGGGCEIALSCDFRIMAAEAKIGLTEIRFGALPLGGGTARLPRLVGLAAARRMIMTGEPVDAAEAERIGLVDRVVPGETLLAEAERFAASLTCHADYALRTAKKLLNITLDLDLAEAMAEERRLVRSMASREQAAAARTDAARRLPTYERIFSERDDRPARGTRTAEPARPAEPGEDSAAPDSTDTSASGTSASDIAASDIAALDITGVLQKEAWAREEFPPVEQIRPGLWSIPVPMPGRMRYVLSYAFELPDGVALVDTGWDSEEAWDGLVAGLAEAGRQIQDVRAVLTTHAHPDHYGLAARVRDVSGAWLGLHPEDAATIGDRDDDALRAGLAAGWETMRARLGVPGSGSGGMSERKARKYIQQTQPDVLFQDGKQLDLPGWDLRAIWTPGHTPGHVCFFEAGHGLLLSGDHILPRISPNVSLHSRQRPDPLQDYLGALAAVGDLPVEEVLPAHEYRFRGLRTRVDQLLGHHEHRLSEIEAAVADTPGAACWSIAARLTWARPWTTLSGAVKYSAAREILAHLVYLEGRGRVRSEGMEPQRWYPGAE